MGPSGRPLRPPWLGLAREGREARPVGPPLCPHPHPLTKGTWGKRRWLSLPEAGEGQRGWLGVLFKHAASCEFKSNRSIG